MFTLGRSIFSEAEKEKIALKIGELVFSAGNVSDRHSVGTSEIAQSSRNQYGEEKVAHNVAMRRKDAEQKFSGDLGQCWQDYIDDYDQIVLDYRLTQDQ